jgi:hypothetical protein
MTMFIKPVDKGSAVVVDKVDYLEETSDGRKILQKTGL